MGFLELEKYNEDKIEEYKKERWIEFFGNQPYTQTPEKILEQADRIVSRIDWTKEERKMYDERTRYIQAYLGHLATVEKEKKDARMEGLAEGIEKGKAEGIVEGIETGKAHGIEYGKKMMIISLIKDGLLSKEEGAKRLNISVIELDEYMGAEEERDYAVLKVAIDKMLKRRNSIGINLKHEGNKLQKNPNAEKLYMEACAELQIAIMVKELR